MTRQMMTHQRGLTRLVRPSAAGVLEPREMKESKVHGEVSGFWHDGLEAGPTRRQRTIGGRGHIAPKRSFVVLSGALWWINNVPMWHCTRVRACRVARNVERQISNAIRSIIHDLWGSCGTSSKERLTTASFLFIMEVRVGFCSFKVTLLAYGYTFISKGTVRAFVNALEHEAAVYKRLGPLQGTHIPVFLGSIDLRTFGRTYYFDHRVYVIYMVFLSWGGEAMDEMDLSNTASGQLRTRLERALRAVHQLGVVHADVRAANVLQNPMTDQMMLIDFERALLMDPPRFPLGQVASNKRKWNSEKDEKIKPSYECSTRRQEQNPFFEDIARAKGMFGPARA